MNSIEFVRRTPMGAVQSGSVAGEADDFVISAEPGGEISLHLNQQNLRSYDRAADDLLITLADGRVIVIEGYFAAGPEGPTRLFLSSDGILQEVTFDQAEGGALFASYGGTEQWGKWSPNDELIFVDRAPVTASAPLPAGDEEEVSMLAAGLLGAPIAAAAGGAGLAGLGALALLGRGNDEDDDDGDGDNGGGGNFVPPTVDDPDSEITVSGNDDPVATVTGTGTPGATVEIEVGGVTGTTTVDEDGTWEVTFEDDTFPPDGDYGDLVVTVTEEDGTETVLDGPSLVIDTTPPALDIGSGVESTDDLFNAEDHEDGVTITGTSEPGATVVVTLGDHSETLTVGEDGTWSVTLDDTVMPEGEYESDITVTSTDGFGNQTVVTDTVIVDTVPHPIAIDIVSGDDLLSGADVENGFTLTGTSTPGATITLTIGDVAVETVVGDDGTWSADIAGGALAEGEYDINVTAATVDAAGNPSSSTRSVQVDTVAEVTLTNTPLTGDDVIDAEEHEAGLTLTGTTQPGSSVQVAIGEVTLDATVAADGTWSVTFESDALASGTYDAQATVTATDLAGNTATTTHDFAVDTEATVTIDDGAGGADGVINASERAEGVVLTGTAEAGATVVVTAGGAELTTTADGDGAWSVTLPTAAIPEGETTLDVSATATDTVGNTSSTTATLTIDTQTSVAFDDVAIAGDDIVNAAEQGEAITVTGTAQPGATVTLDFGGAESVTATVADDGSWTAQIPAGALPTGVADVTLTATATDAAGNTASATREIGVDTLNALTVDVSGDGPDGVANAAELADGLTIGGMTDPLSSVTVTVSGTELTTTADDSGAWSVALPASAVPAGATALTVVATSTDPNGNVVNTTITQQIDSQNAITLNFEGTGTDGVVNADERADGVQITGTTDAGAQVVVSVAGTTLTATADDSGAWSVALPTALIPQGTTDLPVSAVSTDPHGNTATASATLPVDTEVTLSMDLANVETDGVVNATERTDGAPVSGLSDPGATITLTVNGTELPPVTADAAGAWTVTVPAALIPQGTLGLPVTAVARDAAGNTVTATGTLQVDTENALTIATDNVTADGVVNAAERDAGVTLTGTGEPGATVEVTVNGVRLETTVGAGGAWSVPLDAATIPAGTGPLPVTAVSTDRAGNRTVATGTIDVDTETSVELQAQGLGDDNVLNNAERAANGLTITGSAEPGSAVSVRMGTITRDATVSADGTWQAQFFASDVPTGETQVTVTAVSTDAAGNRDTASTQVQVDTLVRDFATTDAGDVADNVLTAAEVADGLQMSGTVEPGSTVSVTLDGVTRPATVSGGTWTVTFPADALPTGEDTVAMTITATDAARNTATLTRNVIVDTVAGTLTIDPDPIEGDDVVNYDEYSDGVTITGTSDPGRDVTVKLGDASKVVTTLADGTWSADFAASEIIEGTYPAEITATITDSRGNTLTRTDSVDVDTEVLNFGFSDTAVAGDNVINAAEALAGVTISGTTEPGATLRVRYGAIDRELDVDPVTGAWSITLNAADLPSGEATDQVMRIDTTDAAGNTASADLPFTVDRIVNELSADTGAVTADGVVNAYEAMNGVTLTGRVEPGSTVMIEFQDVSYEADVSDDGRWSLDIPAGALPQDYSGDLPVTISATDRYGNTRDEDTSIAIDTTVPDQPDWTAVTYSLNEVSMVGIETTDDTVTLARVNDTGSGLSLEAVDINESAIVEIGDETYLPIVDPVDRGEPLVMMTADDAGNLSGAYLVTDDPSGSDVVFTDDLADALSVAQIELIDLSFTEGDLTITEAQIRRLSDTTDTLVVKGGSDDSVTITGATAQGQVTEDGATYNAYALGEATVLIDEEISNVVI